jgi:hypothetical protein
MSYKKYIELNKSMRYRVNCWLGTSHEKPLKRYSCSAFLLNNTREYSINYLFDYINQNEELKNKIIGLFKKVELECKTAIKEINFYENPDHTISEMPNNILEYIDEIEKMSFSAVQCRKYSMLKIIISNLLENAKNIKFISDIKCLAECKTDFNFKKILFWHNLNGDPELNDNNVLGQSKAATYKQLTSFPLEENEKGVPLKNVIIKFNRFSVCFFDMLEDWFMELSDTYITRFKCPNYLIWERGLTLIFPEEIKEFEILGDKFDSDCYLFEYDEFDAFNPFTIVKTAPCPEPVEEN